MEALLLYWIVLKKSRSLLSVLIYGIKCVKMKNKILNLAKSAVWFVLCLFVGALVFEGIRSLANSEKLPLS